ncbi:MAG: hypothetical protein A2044_07420 [Candidatus Firestonebacteria bacterium GWA2_43_8]|nr:MAG: hypothetical protein A2044_07420 [Candidatus Firestonebacteria bacterium GWA2_43_8]
MNKKKTFGFMLLAQSLSAFGDNAVYAVIMGTLLALVTGGTLTPEKFGAASAIYANCLFLPYVLFAPYLGFFSDRFTKKNILVTGNLLKAFGCLVGLLGLLAGMDLLLVSYLLIGIGAAVYSPAKYGIIPELETEEKLVKANAAVEMTTIFSILLGIIGGSLLIDNFKASASYTVLFFVFLLATLFNLLMDNSNIKNKEEKLKKSAGEFKLTLNKVIKEKYLMIPVFGTAIFWAVAAFVKLNLQTWGQNILKLTTATEISKLALWLSLGIILGSFIAGRVFKTGKIKQSWLFGFLMGAGILLLVIFPLNYGLIVAELILIGALGGLFIIPLNAAIQAKAEQSNIGKVIAVQNFFENGAMLLFTGFFWLLNFAKVTPVSTFVIIGGFLCLISALFLRHYLKKL